MNEPTLAPDTNPLPQKPSHKRLVIIIVIGALLIASTTLAVLNILPLYNATTEDLSQTNYPIAGRKTADDLKDWKTYRNEEFGFEVKYPASWITKISTTDNSSGSDLDDYENYRVGFKEEPNEINTWGADLFVSVRTFPDEVNYQNWLKDQYKDPTGKTNVIKIEDAILAGLPAHKATIFAYDKSKLIIDVNKGRKVYQIIYSDPGPNDKINEQHQKQYADIIASFKFVEPTADTAGWKTYKNEGLGVSFKFPSELGEIKSHYFDVQKTPERTSKGKMVWLEFSEGGPTLIASTADLDDMYMDHTGLTANDTKAVCDSYPGADDYCRILTFGSNKIAWKNKFETPECSPFFTVNAYLIRPEHEFKVIKISTFPENINSLVSNKFDCVDKNKQTNAYAEAETQSLNIFNNSSLTQKDHKNIELFKQILETINLTK